MGTNYYVIENYCDHCKRGDQRHIGKSSAGWTFGLRVYPDDGLHDWPDWERHLADKRIEDEYGREVSLAELTRTVTQRSWPATSAMTDEWFRANGARPGPNNLAVRANAPVSDRTYDLCDYEFS